jgi:hypothetical protein
VQFVRRMRQSFGEGGIPSPKNISLVALLVLAIFVVGCGGSEQAQDEPAEDQSTTEQTADAEAQAGTTEAQEEDTEVKGESAGSEGSNQKVTLEIEGDPGTQFSGVCSVGEEERNLGGQVPQSFVYDLKGQRLECQIQKESTGAGSLKITLLSEDNRSLQQISTSGGTVNLIFSGDGIFSSSSSSSSSVNQVVNQVSSSSVSSSSTSTSSR